jgi:hypothetical protein
MNSPNSPQEIQPEDGSEPTSPTVPVADFVPGTADPFDIVDVRISLRIIQRFSEGLYSSPNKAFEELVSNSYDAGANRVWTYVPPDLEPAQATIVVIDDGEAMDVRGLHDLWMIGESRKRDGVARSRPPIGKFGIGKLATYVLARELTFITHRDGEYLAITMDYDKVEGGVGDPRTVRLEVAKLGPDDARSAVTTAIRRAGRGGDSEILTVFADAEPLTWTAAILSNLKPTARNIEQGRLRWILSSALPVSPEFALWYNDDIIDPSKASGEITWAFDVGRSEDELPVDSRVGQQTSTRSGDQTVPAYRLPAAGLIWGKAALYANSLQRGKSELLGRSHGFFVRVRGRLVNLDDATFNVGPELHHGTLTRFNFVVNADEMDDYIASPRESLQDSPALKDLKQYLLAVFNRARAVQAGLDENDTISLFSQQGRISNPPPALTQGPLRRMLQRAVDGDGEIASILALDESSVKLARQLLDGSADLLDQVAFLPAGEDAPLVSYDPERRAAVLNQDHPFVNNYIDVKGAGEPLRLLGLTELLTQAYMLDEDISPAQVGRVVRRRDRFLRDLVKRFPRSSAIIARQLRDASNNETELEDAVADALDLLGFEVTRLGGTNSGTDGIAVARLGRRKGESSESYALTYEAKSSGKDAIEIILPPLEEPEKPRRGRRRASAPRISATTARTSVLRVHRERITARGQSSIAATFTLLVAPGFQGQDEAESLIADTCENDGITPITVEDFARLIELFPVRMITPATLATLFERHTPASTKEFVDSLAGGAPPDAVPVGDILKIIVEFSERRAPVTVDALGSVLFDRSKGSTDLPTDDLRTILRGLAALAPRSMYFDTDVVALNATRRALLDELHGALDDYPSSTVAQLRAAIDDALIQDANGTS